MSISRRGEDGGGGLFQPDLLLSEQIVPRRGTAVSEGERQLMVAVLEDAAHCFQKYLFARDKRGRILFEEAEEWIMEDDTGAAFSFRQVCEVLGLNPHYLRAGLREWQARQTKGTGDVIGHRPGTSGPAESDGVVGAFSQMPSLPKASGGG